MECAFCGSRLEPRSSWRGVTGRFFCGEFCADAEIERSVPACVEPAASARQLVTISLEGD